MKNLPVLFALVVLLFSCEQPEQHQETLSRITNEWNSKNAFVNSFVDHVEIEQIAWQEQYDQMQLTEAELAQLGEETRNQLVEIKTLCREHGATIDTIAEQVEAFAINWEEGTSTLNDLQIKVLEGQEVQNLDEKLIRYDSTLSALPAQFSFWTKKLEVTRQSCQETCNQFAKLAAAVVR